MPTPAQVLSNREQYPDDLEFDWMGEKHTLRVWREQILPMGEFTKVREQATTRIRDLEQTQLTLQQQLATALEEREQAQQTSTRQPSTSEEDDPYIAPLRAEIKTLGQAIMEMRKDRQDELKRQQEERNTQQLNTWYAQIGKLKQQDPELDPEALVKYAHANGMRDMENAYFLMNKDSLMKQAETRGFDKGQKQRPPAYIPGSSRGSTASAMAPPTQPQSIQEAMNNALRDPDVMSALHGENEG